MLIPLLDGIALKGLTVALYMLYEMFFINYVIRFLVYDPEVRRNG